MFDLFADKLAGLRARSFSFRFVLSGSLQCLFLGHKRLLKGGALAKVIREIESAHERRIGKSTRHRRKLRHRIGNGAAVDLARSAGGYLRSRSIEARPRGE